MHPLYGHDRIRQQLAGAVSSGRLPQSLLLEGPRGVGKQRLALWLAGAILCERREDSGAGEPCGECQSCRLVSGLSHPDLHWFMPIELARKDADADKQVELAAETLAEVLTQRRGQPLYEPTGGMASHPIASVRLLLRKLVLRPALSRRKVFILGDAERLVPQLGAEAAANALLKAIEEPPADTTILLTWWNPDALLPTILSRVVRLRVNRVKDSVVTSFAQNELNKSWNPSEVAAKLAFSQGCIGRLLAQDVPGSDAGKAPAILGDGARRGAVATYAFALGQPPFEARGAFTDMLDGLLGRLQTEARAVPTAKLVAAIARVLEARQQAQGNVNPQLLAAVLADDLAVEGVA